MKMKSLKAQFIGAIAMVLVAAIAMGSSTYAWFASNTNAKATAMQVTVKSDNTYLLINTGDNDTVAEIQAAGVSTIPLTVAEADSDVYPAHPVSSASEAAYLPATTGQKVGGGAITTAGAEVTDHTTAAAVTNWYTATAERVTASTMLDGSARQLIAFTDYVITKTAYLTLAVGSNNATDLTVTGHIAPKDIKAATTAKAVAGKYYYTLNGEEYTLMTGVVADTTDVTGKYESDYDISAVRVLVATDDDASGTNKIAILDQSKNGTAQQIEGANTPLTPSSMRTVTIYIYYDGDATAVYTNNKAELGAANISLDFDVTAVGAA